MTLTPEHAPVHGELDCADAEAILHETSIEAADLRARLNSALVSADVAINETDMMRVENARLRALLADVTHKNTSVAKERDCLREQVRLLHEELAVAEADAVPSGTLVCATIAHREMVAAYRTASRITRGPVPPTVPHAVEHARAEIIEAMTQAGQAVLTTVVRREARRRARARRSR